MATAENTAPAEAPVTHQSPSPSFEELRDRMLTLVAHFQLVEQRLRGAPPPYEPAAIVLHEATEALDRLHDDLDDWHQDLVRRTPASEPIEALHQRNIALVDSVARRSADAEK